jgi:hypothetical protein
MPQEEYHTPISIVLKKQGDGISIVKKKKNAAASNDYPYDTIISLTSPKVPPGMPGTNQAANCTETYDTSVWISSRPCKDWKHWGKYGYPLKDGLKVGGPVSVLWHSLVGAWTWRENDLASGTDFRYPKEYRSPDSYVSPYETPEYNAVPLPKDGKEWRGEKGRIIISWGRQGVAT